MAWVIIGGLSSSLLLTLLIVPSTYRVVDRPIARFTRKKVVPQKTQELKVARAISQLVLY